MGSRIRISLFVKPKYDEKDKGRPRMNEQISAQYVRILTVEGFNLDFKLTSISK
ncbi:hypothetical protein Lser_V15G30036 [Lactuca serriola]